MNMSRHINKQELISKVRELTGLTNDEKSALLELLNEKKTYGLVWENHEEAVEEQLREQLPVLREVPERRILSEDAEAPNHIIIEADNLPALIALSYTHTRKFDVIYIDPPYNTGAKNWRYNNDFVDGEDGYKHSKWLSWIKRRLVIAKSLLKETGIIVVTIDDYEIAPLRLLLDEVFSEENYLATVVIKNNPSGRSTVRGFSVNHEYALYYSKSELSSLGRLQHNEKQRSRYSEKDDIGYYEWENFRKNGTDSDRKDRPKQYYPIILNQTTLKVRIPDVVWNDEQKCYDFESLLFSNEIVVWPNTPEGTQKVWKYGIERARTIVDDILVKKKNDNYELYRKKYLNTEGSLPHTWWDKPEYSARDNGTRVLTNIFGPTKVFDFPKAPEAVKDSLIAAGAQKDSLILDFFAGSGTTMHATMQLNAEDGGHRQCILVTNNENNICEEVTYERNKRIIQGYTSTRGEQVQGLTKNNLRYYKADFISREPSSKNKRELVKAATDLLCIKENMYHETKMICNGKALRKDYTRRFTEDCKEMIVIYEPAVIKYIVDELKAWDKKEFIKVYVFSEGRYAYDDDFKEVIDKVTLCALPDAIYQAYRRVLPRRKKALPTAIDLNEDGQAEALADAAQYSYKEEKGSES